MRVGSWPAGTVYTFQWLADGAKVRKGGKSTLRLTRGLVGKRLKVVVVAANPDYLGVSVTSRRTRKVTD